MTAGETVPHTTRFAGAAGVLVGAASIIAGSQVLLGFSTPGYTVIRPLVSYNVLAGFVSIAAGAGLWMRTWWAPRLTKAIAAAHLAVLALLAGLSASGQPVAAESFGAMVFRSVVWLALARVAVYDARHRFRSRSAL